MWRFFHEGEVVDAAVFVGLVFAHGWQSVLVTDLIRIIEERWRPGIS